MFCHQKSLQIAYTLQNYKSVLDSPFIELTQTPAVCSLYCIPVGYGCTFTYWLTECERRSLPTAAALSTYHLPQTTRLMTSAARCAPGSNGTGETPRLSS